MAVILTQGKQAFYGPVTDVNGNVTWAPLAGGLLHTYQAGSLINKPTYSDAAGLVDVGAAA